MIELHDVTKTHSRGQTQVHALRGITCRIPEQAFTFFVGPSGSGKSTLLYLIGCLDEPTSGEIIVGGQRLRDFTSAQRDAYRRTQVGFIFQSFNLLSNLTALENVLVPYMPGGISPRLRSEAVALLGRIGLGDRLSHRPSQLSGGEQQRVAIARALLKRPQYVLADEPTGELDSENGAQVLRDLRSLQAEQGATVLIVTHDQQYIQPGDCVLRIRDGRVAEQATSDVSRTAFSP